MTSQGRTLRPRRAVVLSNPRARRGGEGIGAVLDKLRAGGIELVEAPMESPEQIAATLDAEPDADTAIVCGGDGSLCMAAPGLLARDLALAILPMGTANDLARTLGIPTDLGAAAQLVLDGRRHRIDVGSVNGHPFFNVASIGLSADLARNLTGDMKKRWGRLGYALAAAKTLLGAQRFSAFILEQDATVRTKTLQIAVGNGRFYGGGTIVAEHAAIDDGHLDLYSLELKELWKLALMLKSFRNGVHGSWEEVRTARGTEFEIRTKTPVPVNADGELITETPAVFKVHPDALEVFVPAQGSAG